MGSEPISPNCLLCRMNPPLPHINRTPFGTKDPSPRTPATHEKPEDKNFSVKNTPPSVHHVCSRPAIGHSSGANKSLGTPYVTTSSGDRLSPCTTPRTVMSPREERPASRRGKISPLDSLIHPMGVLTRCRGAQAAFGGTPGSCRKSF